VIIHLSDLIITLIVAQTVGGLFKNMKYKARLFDQFVGLTWEF